MILLNLLTYIGIGIGSGLLARMVLTNVDGQPYHLKGTLGLGILGAVLGGWIGNMTFGVPMIEGFHPNSALMSLVGAVIVVVFLRLMDKERYSR